MGDFKKIDRQFTVSEGGIIRILWGKEDKFSSNTTKILQPP